MIYVFQIMLLCSVACSHSHFVLQEYWTPNNPMQNTIILLIEQIVVALGGEFKLYLPQLIPHMLRVFMHDNSTGRSVTIKVSRAAWRDGKEQNGPMKNPQVLQSDSRPTLG